MIDEQQDHLTPRQVNTGFITQSLINSFSLLSAEFGKLCQQKQLEHAYLMALGLTVSLQYISRLPLASDSDKKLI